MEAQAQKHLDTDEAEEFSTEEVEYYAEGSTKPPRPGRKNRSSIVMMMHRITDEVDLSEEQAVYSENNERHFNGAESDNEEHVHEGKEDSEGLCCSAGEDDEGGDNAWSEHELGKAVGYDSSRGDVFPSSLRPPRPSRSKRSSLNMMLKRICAESETQAGDSDGGALVLGEGSATDWEEANEVETAADSTAEALKIEDSCSREVQDEVDKSWSVVGLEKNFRLLKVWPDSFRCCWLPPGVCKHIANSLRFPVYHAIFIMLGFGVTRPRHLKSFLWWTDVLN